MTVAPCLWLSLFYKRRGLHGAHGWLCVGHDKCDDYEPDTERVA